MKKTLILSSLLLAHVAIAQPGDAEALSKKAHADLKAGRVHEACEGFEASEKLASKTDTELDLAKCYEHDGKPMSAAKWYRLAADKDKDASRGKASAAKATKLESKAPKLRFAINPQPKDIVIKVDGVEVPSVGDVQVDLGPHEVTATATGFEGHASAPADRDGQIVDVILRMQPTAAPAPEPAKPAPALPPATTAAEPAAPMAVQQPPTEPMVMEEGDHRKRNGIIVGVAGVVLVAGAAVLFKLSGDKFDDEHSLCPDSKCATPDDLSRAHSLLDDGHLERGFAYGVGIAGIVGIAGGAYLLATHKSPEEAHMSLNATHDSAGVAWTGHF